MKCLYLRGWVGLSPLTASFSWGRDSILTHPLFWFLLVFINYNSPFALICLLAVSDGRLCILGWKKNAIKLFKILGYFKLNIQFFISRIKFMNVQKQFISFNFILIILSSLLCQSQIRLNQRRCLFKKWAGVLHCINKLDISFENMLSFLKTN